jgi:hypothetical protein
MLAQAPFQACEKIEHIGLRRVALDLSGSHTRGISGFDVGRHQQGSGENARLA